MDNFIDRSHFFCIRLLLHHKTFKLKSRVLVCSIPWLCNLKETKNGHFHNVGKVGKSNATPIKLFSVDFYDQKTMSFKFFNDICITFEMPRQAGPTIDLSKTTKETLSKFLPHRRVCCTFVHSPEYPMDQ